MTPERPEKMSALARVLENMINHGAIAGIAERIDILYAAAKLTDDEYAYLMGILPPPNSQEEVNDRES